VPYEHDPYPTNANQKRDDVLGPFKSHREWLLSSPLHCRHWHLFDVAINLLRHEKTVPVRHFRND